jgi:hypothetical protein
MTTLEHLQIEALMRGLTVEELMEQYRGTETDIGAQVAEADVDWLREFAFVLTFCQQREIRH